LHEGNPEELRKNLLKSLILRTLLKKSGLGPGPGVTSRRNNLLFLQWRKLLEERQVL
jgi:hypothetical protein